MTRRNDCWLFRWMLGSVMAGWFPVCSAAWAVAPDQSNADFTLSLNGAWEFALSSPDTSTLGEAFFTNDFTFGGWKSVPVPGHWLLAGFQPPREISARPVSGLYRRRFTLPREWINRRCFLRFEGVMGRFQAWVNGRAAGRQTRSGLPGQFEITSLLNGSEEHLLAVRVDSARIPDATDTVDLSGIFRDVRLFAVPSPCIDDWSVQCEIKDPAESAQARIVVNLLHRDDNPDWSGITVNCRLDHPGGKTVAEVEITSLEVSGPRATGRVSLPAAQPLLWTAETPNLYRLTLELKQSGQVLHRITGNVGLRQVTIRKGELALNGVPIHLRGVNYTEVRPDVGMALREEHWRRDLEQMKQANINALRPLSGPLHPRFLELCDELGFYVIGELPVYGIDPAPAADRIPDSSPGDFVPPGARDAGEEDPVQTLISRDRNHPCVITWSLGDHPAWDPSLLETVRMVHSLDPTRPVLMPGCADPSLPAEVEILAPRNPSLETWKKLARAGRPVIAVSHTPALGGAVEGLDEFWRTVMENRNLAGGMLQQFADSPSPDIFPHGSAAPGEYRSDGQDGIVGADRTPQSGFWQVRKIYSPVRVEETALPVKPGRQILEIPLRNEHDFLNLAALRCRWFLRRDGEPVIDRPLILQLAPQQSMEVALVLDLPNDLPGHEYTVRLTFNYPSGWTIDEHVVRLLPRNWEESFVLRLRDLKWDEEFQVVGDAQQIRCEHRDYAFIIQQTTASWFMRAKDHNIRLINGGPYLRVGRDPHPAELRHGFVGEASPLWRPPLLRGLWVDTKQMEKFGRDVLVQSLVRGESLVPPETALRAQVDYLFSPFGFCDVQFMFDTENLPGGFLETGLAFQIPAAMNQAAWLGEGPYPSFPGQEALASRGVFFANPLSRFLPGPRAGADALLFRDANGYGLGIMMLNGQFSLEPSEEGTVVTILAATAGLGNGAYPTRHPLIARDLPPERRSAAFRIVPLIRGRYPAFFQNLWEQAVKWRDHPIP
ncbi:MAG: glycoside hydrolase family 2 TIM barrel-domain containing protein [bacterium]